MNRTAQPLPGEFGYDELLFIKSYFPIYLLIEGLGYQSYLFGQCGELMPQTHTILCGCLAEKVRHTAMISPFKKNPVKLNRTFVALGPVNQCAPAEE